MLFEYIFRFNLPVISVSLNDTSNMHDRRDIIARWLQIKMTPLMTHVGFDDIVKDLKCADS